MNDICGYSFEDFLEKVRAFHGHTAPGVVLGGFMVDLARGSIPEGVLFDAVCETRKCLPDAVQILTPCSFGNGWLRVLDYGRFALSLFDKHGGDGVRVFLDPAKLARWPEIDAWLFKRKPKAQQDKDRLLSEIGQARREILGLQRVTLKDSFLKKESSGAIGLCPACGEAFPTKDGAVCLACRDGGPYTEQR